MSKLATREPEACLLGIHAMGLYRQKGSPFWWYSFSFEGRRVFASTGVTDYKAARQIYTIKRNEHTLRKVRDELPPIKLRELLARYLEDYSKVNKVSHSTDLFRAKTLGDFIGDKLASDVTPHDLERYKAHRRQSLHGGEPISVATINRELGLLKAVFNKGVEWSLVKENPVKRIRFFSEKDRARTRYLSAEEKGRLLAAASPELRRILVVALKTGCRYSEILGLRWADIDSVSNTLMLRKTKTKTIRHIPLHPDVVEALNSLPRRGEYVFADENGERPNRSSWVRSQFEGAVRHAGIKDFHFHDLRHTFASELVMKGVDLKTVSELLGHSTTRLTERYAHLSPAHKGVAISMLDSETKPRSADSALVRKTSAFAPSV